jgi:hypothetical protein
MKSSGMLNYDKKKRVSGFEGSRDRSPRRFFSFHRMRCLAFYSDTVLPRGSGTLLTLEEILELLNRKGMGKKETLHAVAPIAGQKILLLLGFHPFGDGIDVQVAGHGDDGFDDFLVPFAAHRIGYKGSVNLQGVDGEPLQVAQ